MVTYIWSKNMYENALASLVLQYWIQGIDLLRGKKVRDGNQIGLPL